MQYDVLPNKKYRLRMINAASGSTVNFRVENHSLELFQVDGHQYISPIVAENITVFVGQRYDALLTTNKPVDNYWIRATGFRCLQTHAVLSYADARNWNLRKTPAPKVDNITSDPFTYGFLPDNGHMTPDPGNPTTKSPTVTRTVWVGCCENVSNPTGPLDETCNFADGRIKKAFCWSRPSQTAPKTAFPWPSVTDTPALCHTSDAVKFSQWPYVRLEHGERLRLHIFNEDMHSSHPVHIHGHSFSVVGLGKKGELKAFAKASIANNQSKLFFKPPYIMRDTIQIASDSWATIEFDADNPGVWLLHCHIDWHLELGFAMAFTERTMELPADTCDGHTSESDWGWYIFSVFSVFVVVVVVTCCLQHASGSLSSH